MLLRTSPQVHPVLARYSGLAQEGMEFSLISWSTAYEYQSNLPIFIPTLAGPVGADGLRPLYGIWAGDGKAASDRKLRRDFPRQRSRVLAGARDKISALAMRRRGGEIDAADAVPALNRPVAVTITARQSITLFSR